MTDGLPPALEGHPLIGHAVAYLRDPVGLIRRGYERHGRVFSLRLGPQRVVVLVGPELNRLFFRETDRCLSMEDAHRWVVPMFGSYFPLAASVADHRRLRPAYAEPFRAWRIEAYTEAMGDETEAWLDGFGERGEIEIPGDFERLVLRLACRTILGDRVRLDLGGRLEGLYRRISAHADHHLTRNLPLPRVRLRLARRRLRAAARREVDRRRSGEPAAGDVLGALLAARTTEGRPLDEETVVDLALGLVWATYPTTTGQLAWALAHLLENPDYLTTVVDEIDTTSAGDPHDPERLERLERALQETERLRPPVLVLGRHTRQEYAAGGHRVPAGWTTLISPAVTHRLAEVFPEPNRYDPDRFARPRDGSSSPAVHLVGFGGGTHACLGKRFALTAMKVVLARLLARYELELATAPVEPRAGVSPNTPRGPVVVRYRTRSL